MKLKVEVFGRLCVRAVLLLVRKQKLGRETKTWESFDSIRDRFAEEIMGPKAAQQSPARPAEPPASGPVNLLDASKASMILMQNKHLEIHANYLNVEAHGNKIFKLAEVTDAGCRFEHKPLLKDPEIVLVAPSEDMHKWKKTKKTEQVLYDQSVTHPHMWTVSPAASDPIELARTQIALYEATVDQGEANESVRFLGPPMAVCASRAMGKGKLRLVAYGLLGTSDAKASHKVSGCSLHPPKAISDMDKLQEDGKAMFVPFWYVKTTSDGNQANMRVAQFSKNGMKIPCMINDRELEVGEVLYVLAPSAESKGVKRKAA